MPHTRTFRKHTPTLFNSIVSRTNRPRFHAASLVLQKIGTLADRHDPIRPSQIRDPTQTDFFVFFFQINNHDGSQAFEAGFSVRLPKYIYLYIYIILFVLSSFTNETRITISLNIEKAIIAIFVVMSRRNHARLWSY